MCFRAFTEAHVLIRQQRSLKSRLFLSRQLVLAADWTNWEPGSGYWLVKYQSTNVAFDYNSSEEMLVMKSVTQGNVLTFFGSNTLGD